MDIHSLGYVRLESTNVEQWRSFARDILGAAVNDGPDGALHVRLDDRPYRIAIIPSDTDRFGGAAFEVRDGLSFENAIAELEAAGVAVKHGTADDAKDRCVEAFASFEDPNGNPIEVFFSPVTDSQPVQFPFGGAFLTGSLGMGHVVLPSPDIDAAFNLFTRVMGFRHRDSMAINFPNGTTVRLRFLGCNPRHHTIALTQTPSPVGLRHMMIEADSIKTFGRTFARARAAGVLKTELGQHSNDEVLSFYLNCPGGFEIEYGVHGRHVDDDGWLTRDLTELSYWGYWPFTKPVSA